MEVSEKQFNHISRLIIDWATGEDFQYPYDGLVFKYNDCDYYLKSIYGNYMRIPKNVRGHGRLNKLRYDDINLLRQSVEELREFNANFK